MFLRAAAGGRSCPVPHSPSASQLCDLRHDGVRQRDAAVARTGPPSCCRPLAAKAASAMSAVFFSSGKFCASHPCEVIVAFLTLSICLMSVAPSPAAQACAWPARPDGTGTVCQVKEMSDGDALLVTAMRCIAFLYVYHQLSSLYRLGSKYLVGIACLFTIFSSLIFASGVVSVLNKDFGELFSTALPLFLLLTELPRARLLAQFALSSNSKDELRENIAKGMAILCPCFTLDMLVKILAIGVGTLSGAKRIEELSYLACLSVLVNYMTFLTFFPACLSLALELSHTRSDERPVWQLSSLTKVLQLESEQAPNPVIQRVKLIMSAGLTLVHTFSRLQVENTAHDRDSSNASQSSPSASVFVPQNSPSFLNTHLKSIFGAEQFILVALVTALAVKYIFFDARDGENISLSPDMIKQSRPSSTDAFKAKDQSPAEAPTIIISQHSQDSDTESAIAEQQQRVLSNGKSNGTRRPFFIGDDDSEASDDSETMDQFCQTDDSDIRDLIKPFKSATSLQPRPLEALLSLLNSEDGAKDLSDQEVLILIEKKCLQSYRLELALNDPVRGVHIRRLLLNIQTGASSRDPGQLDGLPFHDYDYTKVMGACCENVIGYVPIPVGIAGPLKLDGIEYFIPMATTEGCLVASTNRGCRALGLGGGVHSMIVGDGMTRAPVVQFPSAMRAAEVMNWLKEPHNFAIMKESFDSTSRFARLLSIKTRISANLLYIRLSAETGDAMGMNMLSKGAEIAMHKLKEIFPDMDVLGLSGNLCTDKKPSAVNWIEGRGKSVVCEAIIPAKVVEEVLKTNVPALESLNINKNLIGSALAGSIGGFNAHAANIVTAVFLATGQDPAQNVGSSNCMTMARGHGPEKKDLYFACTMPSIEVGTIGGGTILPAQSACLQMLGVRGSCNEEPGRNARQLARIVCAAVLAAELSVLSALAAGHLVRSHMKHNRSTLSVNASDKTSVGIDSLCKK